MTAHNHKNPVITTLSPENEKRLTAVIHLAETCNYEASHTQQVTRLALRLFDELAVLHQLGERERFWLQCAAWLHDIGWVEGQKGHHKTALRIILSTPLLPFDSKERLIIGSIARYHRKALPSPSHDHFASLNPEEQQSVRVLSGLLRLADGLDRAHQNRVQDLTCKVSKQHITVTCYVAKVIPGEALLPLEKRELFELVFQRKLNLTFKKSHNG